MAARNYETNDTLLQFVLVDETVEYSRMTILFFQPKETMVFHFCA